MIKSTSFQENQAFPRWLMALLGLVFMIPLAQCFFSLNAATSFKFDESVFALLFGLVILVFFLGLRLRTRIDTDGIHIKFSPFINKQIPWREVESTELVKYSFFTGWGLRWSNKYGWVYNTAGNEGLFLRLKNGKKMLIGSQETVELSDVLRALRHKGIIK